MQQIWVIKNNSKKLIIFFNGWSLDENIVNHFNSADYDVLMFNDYCNLEIADETIEKINSYSEINVIAWSFGVWACGNIIDKIFDAAQSKLQYISAGGLANPPYENDSGQVLIAPQNFKNVIAINGTPIPIDNNLGIPEKIFNLTLTHLSEENYIKFFKNMFVSEADLNKLPKRNVENQKQELQQIQNLSALCPRLLWERDEFQCEERALEIRGRSIREIAKFFNKVFISANDKIISAKNQLNFWNETDAKIKQIDSGHYIFDLFNTWDEIIYG